MQRIWIFFNKQTIYLETTTQRNNQIAERAGTNLRRSHSWKYRHPQQSTYPWEVFSADLFAIFKAVYWGNCTWFNLSRLTHRKKYQKSNLFFTWFFPWIHQYPCSDESQVWIEPGFFLDYFVQYRKSVIFPALDIKKTGFNLDF